MTTSPIEWCGASARAFGPMPIGPCVLRHGHDGPLHRDEAGVSWTDPRPASESSEPLCGSALRDRLAKALRGKHDSTDSRPSYRAADALVPVVEEEIRRRGLAVADPDSLLLELDEAHAVLERIRTFAASLQDPGAPLFWPEMGRRIQLELDQPSPASTRCPSCDHRADLHQPDGCWHTVTTGTTDRDSVCPCTMPRAALDEPKESA